MATVRTCGDLIVYFFAQSVFILAYAIVKRNTHSDGSDVEIFLVDHAYGFKNVLCINH